jgi:hypothetical protein
MHKRSVISALPPKADMCSAAIHVYFGPKADMSIQLKGMSRELARQALPPAVARVFYYPLA